MFIGLPTIRVQGIAHEADIRSNSMTRTAELQQKFRLTDDEKNDIASKTASRAGGMFLFARLVMDNLSQQVTTDMGTTILLPDLDSYCCVLRLEVPILLYHELATCIPLYCNILQYAKTS